MENIGISKIVNSILTVQIEYFLFVTIIFFVCIITQTLKWKLILDRYKVHLPFEYILKLYLIGQFYGAVTPAKIGSFIRVPYLSEKIKKPPSECISNVMIERFIDLFVLFVLSIMGSLLLIQIFSNLFLELIVIFVLFLIAIIIFSSPNRSKKILSVLYKYIIPKKFKKYANESFHAFYEAFPRLRDLSLPLILGFVAWVLAYTQLYIFSLSLGIEIPYIYFITLYPIASIVGLIPITICGLGTREATLIFLFSFFNILPEKIIGLSLIGFIFNLVLIMSFGGISIKLIEK